MMFKTFSEDLAVVKVEVEVIEASELNLDEEVVFVLQTWTTEVSDPTVFL